jgi:hypothetical protein
LKTRQWPQPRYPNRLLSEMGFSKRLKNFIAETAQLEAKHFNGIMIKELLGQIPVDKFDGLPRLEQELRNKLSSMGRKPMR